MQLIIGDYNYSSWSMRGWLAARASGLPFETVQIPLREADTADHIGRYSPSGRVPCLIDGEGEGRIAIWDSLAIAEYLAELNPALWPADARARAVARAVSAEMHSGFTALRTHMSMNIRKDYAGHGRTPEVLAEIARIDALWQDCRQRFGMQAPVAGPWLFGAWSIADIMYAPVCMRFATYAVGEDALSPLACRYLGEVLTHPHVQEWRVAASAETHLIAAYDSYG
ncbi:glutathione S-transferase family protein [Uliginosibacterium sp. H3]|uniref:Glutathione S-transferase family protein n=1 Tax=Uliginosibacterium silvisoli TaxID=3114758 RepID=A0ABU6K061_9RHOO|nr:glutathione S-transferase family protein [Uliginosibacterium sp. H3]